MQSKIIIGRLAICMVAFFTVFIQANAKELRDAPVSTGFVSNQEKMTVKEGDFRIEKVRYNSYDAYFAYDKSNYDCDEKNPDLADRKIPKYQDDYPMFETFGYDTKNRCADIYYPYNYPAPK